MSTSTVIEAARTCDIRSAGVERTTRFSTLDHMLPSSSRN